LHKKSIILSKTTIIGVIFLFSGMSLVSSSESISEFNFNNYITFDSIDEVSNDFPFSTIWYLYSNYGGSEGPGFYAWGPGNITRFGKWDGEPFYCGTWTNYGKFFCCQDDTGILYEINPKTLEASIIGGGGVNLRTLSYDPITEYLYGIDHNNYLFKINENTGELDLVGSISGGPYLIVCSGFDINGTLYGIDLGTDSLWIINIDTGEATYVGALGISLNYVEAGDFDKVDDCIYFKMYTTSAQWYKCDKTTGACTLIGFMDGGFSANLNAISYELNMIPPITEISFYPPLSNNWLSEYVTVTLNATDNTGVIDTFYRLNGEEWIKYESPFVISEDENYIIEYYSYDYVGNIEEVNVYIYPENNPPSTPKIEGKRKFKEGEGGRYPYTIHSVDPEGYDVLYLIDWLDGNTSGWFGPYRSGEKFTKNITIPSVDGIWTLFKIKAKDIYDAESDWAILEIEVSRTRASSYLRFEWLLDSFPMLERLLTLLSL